MRKSIVKRVFVDPGVEQLRIASAQRSLFNRRWSYDVHPTTGITVVASRDGLDLLSYVPSGAGRPDIMPALIALYSRSKLIRDMMNDSRTMRYLDDDVQYWSLKSAFKKIGKGIKKGVSKVGGLLKKGVKFLGEKGLLKFIPGVGPVAQAAYTGSQVIKSVQAAKKAKKKAKQAALAAKEAQEAESSTVEGGYSHQMLPQHAAGGTTQPSIDVPQGATSGTAQPSIAGSEGFEQSYSPVSEYEPEFVSVGEGLVESEPVELESLPSEVGWGELVEAYGPEEAWAVASEMYPEETMDAELFAELADQIREVQGYAAVDAVCDSYVTPSFVGSGKVKNGEFYRSKLVTARVVPSIGDGIFGEVRLNEFPFPIRVSGNAGNARATVALAHELAHVANQLYKLGLTHNQVHDIGVFYATEGVPALAAMKEHAR